MITYNVLETPGGFPIDYAYMKVKDNLEAFPLMWKFWKLDFSNFSRKVIFSFFKKFQWHPVLDLHIWYWSSEYIYIKENINNPV